MKKTIFLVTILVAVIIGLYLLFIYAPSRSYNDGICPNCGAHYEEHQWLYHGDSYTKFKCEQCGHSGFIADWLK